MFTKAIITRAPSNRFVFVGRVPASLVNAAFDTVEEAKCAAVGAMISMGETFPVDVQSISPR